FAASLQADTSATIATQSGVATLMSSASAQMMWSFRINDGGAGDGLATRVNALDIDITLANTMLSINDFAWFLSMAGGSDIPATINGNTLSFAAAPLALVPDGDQVIGELKVATLVMGSSDLDGTQI